MPRLDARVAQKNCSPTAGKHTLGMPALAAALNEREEAACTAREHRERSSSGISLTTITVRAVISSSKNPPPPPLPLPLPLAPPADIMEEETELLLPLLPTLAACTRSVTAGSKSRSPYSSVKAPPPDEEEDDEEEWGKEDKKLPALSAMLALEAAAMVESAEKLVAGATSHLIPSHPSSSAEVLAASRSVLPQAKMIGIPIRRDSKCSVRSKETGSGTTMLSKPTNKGRSRGDLSAASGDRSKRWSCGMTLSRPAVATDCGSCQKPVLRTTLDQSLGLGTTASLKQVTWGKPSIWKPFCGPILRVSVRKALWILPSDCHRNRPDRE